MMNPSYVKCSNDSICINMFKIPENKLDSCLFDLLNLALVTLKVVTSAKLILFHPKMLIE
jgi:hypothetical protein